MSQEHEDGAERTGDARPIDTEQVERFWSEARTALGLTDLSGIIATTTTALITPPAWQFWGERASADRLSALVAQGRKTATASVQAEYEQTGESLPTEGELSIVCDGSGAPVVLVRSENVRVVPFNRVDEAHARAEGEGDLSLAYWRRSHLNLLPGHEGAVAPDEDSADDEVPEWVSDESWPADPMVLEDLVVLYPRPPAPSVN